MTHTAIPATQRVWKLEGKDDPHTALVLREAPVPAVSGTQVLVKIKALSLNFRDLMMLHNTYSWPRLTSPIPLSDGAGVVASTGPSVSRFRVGDRVSPIFAQTHFAGLVTDAEVSTTLGGPRDGVAAQYAVFDEHGLVRIPDSLSFEEAASIPVAGVTAWNCLYGLEGRTLKPGEWVLVQGTGGVSIFALQLAKAARLTSLGADHVLNYRTTPDWGAAARALVPGGFAHVIDVGGASTLPHSLVSVRRDGVISVVGRLDGSGAEPGLSSALVHTAIVRGIWVGSRAQFDEVNSAIEANGIKPVIDARVFVFDELPAACAYLEAQKHFGKVVVRVE
ncbi:Zinc-type alcohol dehydrogenase-like protein [Vanrija pseudolonga]|uniref:Zinc-type alcohol dehydrogenase-like protein n=1 Tax=Vanrija pseudolonga TaxID=143232 RepID=A0AAF0YAI5_9TREE|nr:Zinc-type alcohol dehydrogenase-like protein [Vanrija pseudolonga]